jgi:hypothetical protein
MTFSNNENHENISLVQQSVQSVRQIQIQTQNEPLGDLIMETSSGIAVARAKSDYRKRRTYNDLQNEYFKE